MKLFKIYKTYLLSQNNGASATKLSKILNSKYSHDKITRFLNQSNLSNTNLWNSVSSDDNFKISLKNSQTCLIIDDTIIPKEYRQETDQACWHYDHSKGRCLKGIQYMTCFLTNVQYSLPINYRIIEKTEKHKDKETQRTKRKSKVTKNELFREMLDQSSKKLKSDYKYILADSWFCSKDNIKHINDKLQKKFILGIKSNRLIKLDGTHNFVYKCINKTDLEPEKAYRVKLKGLDIPLVLVKKVFKNGGKGHFSSGYYISNDLGLTGEQLYNCYQKRWQVEEYHRFIKQNVSIGTSPCRSKRSVSNHLALSLMAYVDLVYLSKRTKCGIHSLRYQILIKSNKSAFNALQLIQKSVA